MHDRRLVILEEIKGASTEVIGKLTDMRSSGIAEIPKIERRRTHARTRLVCISNPRSAKPISAYSFGVEAVSELIGALEDIRRFDMALCVSSDEVDLDHMKPPPPVEHVYTTDLCRRLVLWSWTLPTESITFTSEAHAVIDSWSTRLASRFTEGLPLVDRGTIRYKLARMAASLAVRTFSFEHEQLVVRDCHVDFIGEFLERVYSGEVMGYLDFSYAQASLNQITDKTKLMHFIRKCTKHPLDLINGLLYLNEIGLNDVQDFCEVDRDTAQGIVSLLVRTHAIKRSVKNAYVKTSDFIELLKEMKGSTTNQPETEEEM
jgi:hypothetical protein